MIVDYDPESAMNCDSRGISAFDSELEGLYLDEPLADDNWIAEYGIAKYGRPKRGARRYKIARFDNI